MTTRRFNREAWFADMRERAAEMIADGADADMLASFEKYANDWLAYRGFADPARPFRVLNDDGGPPPGQRPH